MSALRGFSSLVTKFLRPVVESAVDTKPGGLFDLSVRYNTRNYFPKACEVKRITKHGYKKRITTPGGQRILMRRLLKGKFVLSH